MATDPQHHALSDCRVASDGGVGRIRVPTITQKCARGRPPARRLRPTDFHLKRSIDVCLSPFRPQPFSIMISRMGMMGSTGLPKGRKRDYLRHPAHPGVKLKAVLHGSFITNRFSLCKVNLPVVSLTQWRALWRPDTLRQKHDHPNLSENPHRGILFPAYGSG